MENLAIVIHGGAGTILKENLPPEIEKQYRNKLAEALQAGYRLLKKGESSIAACETAVKIMEDSPLFNAGKGAVFSSEGKNEMDASIMDGQTMKAGAVAGVCTIKNPVSAAKAVMENSEHVMLAGEGAEQFAKQEGMVIVDRNYFFDQKRWDQLQLLKKEEATHLHLHRHQANGSISPLDVEFLCDKKFGTVGACALDKNGNIAAATSTGGTTNKKFGRVGDSPIIGAGTYANNKTCAVSCTGHGEFFIRFAVAHDVSALMEYKGRTLEQAANEVVNKLLKAGGKGGLIALDVNGNIAMPFNTSGMYRGWMKGEKSEVKIYKDE